MPTSVLDSQLYLYMGWSQSGVLHSLWCPWLCNVGDVVGSMGCKQDRLLPADVSCLFRMVPLHGRRQRRPCPIAMLRGLLHERLGSAPWGKHRGSEEVEVGHLVQLNEHNRRRLEIGVEPTNLHHPEGREWRRAAVLATAQRAWRCR